MRMAAEIKETKLPFAPYESNLEKVKKKYKKKFPNLVEKYRSGGRVCKIAKRGKGKAYGKNS